MWVGIDPGPVQSAIAMIRADGSVMAATYETLGFGKFYHPAHIWFDRSVPVAIEKIASYGMAVGESVFATCYESGRIAERIEQITGVNVVWVPRLDVKMLLCGQAKAKDGNIRQAIMDRYGSTREVAIGTRKKPGPLYGVAGDQWAALGVALVHKAKMEGWKR